MSGDVEFLNLVRNEKTVTKLAPGQVLFHKGEPAQAMYVVRAGQLQIGEGSVVYETVGPGDIVGEMAMIDTEPRSATVKALGASEVVVIDQARFLYMVQQTPFFAIRVMQVLAQRLRIMNERLAKG
jgi:CRP/FNR family transcriptional regulator, cyclic AMP receptor protein